MKGYTKDLRGRMLNQNFTPINITLEVVLDRLDANYWDLSKLNVYSRKVINSYKLSKIADKLKVSNIEERKRIIRENILTLYGDDIGDNCLSIYFLIYCINKNPEITIKKSVKKFFEKEGITKSISQISTITDIGLKDGLFLNLLNIDYSFDHSFIYKWTCVYTDYTFNKVILNFESDEIYRNRFLLYHKIKDKQINFRCNIEKGSIKQQNKLRLVYKVKKESDEEVSLKYLKKKLDLEFNIKYSNREFIMRELFPIIENINSLGNYTIYRYDFKNFFESVNAQEVFRRYIFNSNLRRFEKDLLKNLVDIYEYCFAGLSTSNAFVEIIASRFDQVLQTKFKKDGLFLYARYVDDGILIFNQFIEKAYIEDILTSTINEVFDMASVILNNSKTCYMTKSKETSSFNYLGYQFEKKGGKFIFGIADSKIQKYQNRLDCIITEYRKDNNVELFRHRLQYYISRIVFYTNTNSRFSKLGKWDVNGIIANYSLLRKPLLSNKKMLNRKTENFLEKGIIDRCSRAGLVNKDLPYFLRKDGAKCYSLAYGLRKNKSIIFYPNIGWSTEYLKKQILELAPTIDLEKKPYRELSKIYYSILEL